MKNLSSFTHPQVVLKPYIFLSSMEYKRSNEACGSYNEWGLKLQKDTKAP